MRFADAESRPGAGFDGERPSLPRRTIGANPCSLVHLYCEMYTSPRTIADFSLLARSNRRASGVSPKGVFRRKRDLLRKDVQTKKRPPPSLETGTSFFEGADVHANAHHRVNASARKHVSTCTHQRVPTRHRLRRPVSVSRERRRPWRLSLRTPPRRGRPSRRASGRSRADPGRRRRTAE